MEDGLGLFGLLGERLLLNFLRRVPVWALLRLMEASKSLFVAATYWKLWKRVAIKRWGGHFEWKGSWRLTALLPRECDLSLKPVGLRVPHQWTAARFPEALGPRLARCEVPMEQLAGRREDVERVDARTLTVEEFLERFDRGNRPCILTHAMDEWPAMRGAWDKEALAQRFLERRFLTDEVNARGHKMKMTMRAYFKYMGDNDDSDPIYLFDPKFAKHSGDAEAILADYAILPYFAEDFFSLLSKKREAFLSLARLWTGSVGIVFSHGSVQHQRVERTGEWQQAMDHVPTRMGSARSHKVHFVFLFIFSFFEKCFSILGAALITMLLCLSSGSSTSIAKECPEQWNARSERARLSGCPAGGGIRC